MSLIYVYCPLLVEQIKTSAITYYSETDYKSEIS